MIKYTGITIGPISDTIKEASTPAGLWFASSMFSDITKRMCSEILSDSGFAGAVIYSPYYEPDALFSNDGVGKYHDRIIFSALDFDADKMNHIITKVKRETAENFHNTSEECSFFEKYLQIHFVSLTEEEIGKQNCVLALSPYLDALELMKTFPENDAADPVRKLLQGAKNGTNRYVKESRLFTQINVKSNQFVNENGDIWRIEDIASSHGKVVNDLKYPHYYAVVSADGDSMGNFLDHLKSDEVTLFSECCLTYDKAAAELIDEFGGMTIYAGGDDLLFLVPVMNERKESVFDLCHDIQKKFHTIIAGKEVFTENLEIPTVSFGISIQYKKFPLYEALDYSRRLLSLAKSDIKKNNMLIGILKHSGKSISVLVGNDVFGSFKKIWDLDEGLYTVTSIIYILEQSKPLIRVLNKETLCSNIDYTAYEYAWMNLFDNSGQKPAEEYLKAVCHAYYHCLLMEKKNRIREVKDSFSEGYYSGYGDKGEYPAALLVTSLEALLCLLEIKKFMKEKEGERQ